MFQASKANVALSIPMPSAGNNLTDFSPVPEEDPDIHKPVTGSPSCEDSRNPPRASWLWIYTLCIANFGITGAWALSTKFAITTPYFETGLKADRVLSHSVWVVGPLSGLIVAPIVGTLSDRCTSRFGRRRPFILAGVVSTVLGMIFFSNAKQIASLAFVDGTAQHKWTAIVIAILAFCVTDLAINTTMWPVRALQGDLVPDYQQHDLQSASIVVGSFGDLAANFLLRSFEEPVTHIGFCFAVAALFYTAAVSVLLIVGKEVPVEVDDPNIQDARRQSLNIMEYLRGLPRWMWRVGGTYALGFFALFCIMPNASSWIGASVLGGDPNGIPGSKGVKEYERGVSIYGRAGLVRAAIQIVYSAIYPWLLKGVSAGQMMGTSFAIFGVLMVALAGTKSLMVAEVVVVLLALPMAAHFTVPIGMTVENSDASNRGRYLGALNCFAVIPQLIDTMYTGYVSRAWGEAAVMRVGGIWALLTAISAFLNMWV